MVVTSMEVTTGIVPNDNDGGKRGGESNHYYFTSNDVSDDSCYYDECYDDVDESSSDNHDEDDTNHGGDVEDNDNSDSKGQRRRQLEAKNIKHVVPVWICKIAFVPIIVLVMNLIAFGYIMSIDHDNFRFAMKYGAIPEDESIQNDFQYKTMTSAIVLLIDAVILFCSTKFIEQDIKALNAEEELSKHVTRLNDEQRQEEQRTLQGIDDLFLTTTDAAMDSSKYLEAAAKACDDHHGDAAYTFDTDALGGEKKVGDKKYEEKQQQHHLHARLCRKVDEYFYDGGGSSSTYHTISAKNRRRKRTNEIRPNNTSSRSGVVVNFLYLLYVLCFICSFVLGGMSLYIQSQYGKEHCSYSDVQQKKTQQGPKKKEMKALLTKIKEGNSSVPKELYPWAKGIVQSGKMSMATRSSHAKSTTSFVHLNDGTTFFAATSTTPSTSSSSSSDFIDYDDDNTIHLVETDDIASKKIDDGSSMLEQFGYKALDFFNDTHFDEITDVEVEFVDNDFYYDYRGGGSNNGGSETYLMMVANDDRKNKDKQNGTALVEFHNIQDPTSFVTFSGSTTSSRHASKGNNNDNDFFCCLYNDKEQDNAGENYNDSYSMTTIAKSGMFRTNYMYDAGISHGHLLCASTYSKNNNAIENSTDDERNHKFHNVSLLQEGQQDLNDGWDLYLQSIEPYDNNNGTTPALYYGALWQKYIHDESTGSSKNEQRIEFYKVDISMFSNPGTNGIGMMLLENVTRTDNWDAGFFRIGFRSDPCFAYLLRIASVLVVIGSIPSTLWLSKWFKHLDVWMIPLIVALWCQTVVISLGDDKKPRDDYYGTGNDNNQNIMISVVGFIAILFTSSYLIFQNRKSFYCSRSVNDYCRCSNRILLQQDNGLMSSERRRCVVWVHYTVSCLLVVYSTLAAERFDYLCFIVVAFGLLVGVVLKHPVLPVVGWIIGGIVGPIVAFVYVYNARYRYGDPNEFQLSVWFRGFGMILLAVVTAFGLISTEQHCSNAFVLLRYSCRYLFIYVRRTVWTAIHPVIGRVAASKRRNAQDPSSPSLRDAFLDGHYQHERDNCLEGTSAGVRDTATAVKRSFRRPARKQQQSRHSSQQQHYQKLLEADEEEG